MLEFINGSQKVWTFFTITFLVCSFATNRDLVYHWLFLFGLSLTLLMIDLMFNYGNEQFLYDPEWKSWKSKNERGNNY